MRALDPRLHSLGKLCLYGHDYERTGKSLRTRRGGCVACADNEPPSDDVRERAREALRARSISSLQGGHRKTRALVREGYANLIEQLLQELDDPDPKRQRKAVQLAFLRSPG